MNGNQLECKILCMNKNNSRDTSNYMSTRIIMDQAGSYY